MSMLLNSLKKFFMEKWVDIKGYETLYMVSDKGRVFSCRRNKVLADSMCRGYCRVNLIKNKSRKTMFVHQLVAKSFIDNPENKIEVNHLNKNRSDNRVENLEWANRKENSRHAFPNCGKNKLTMEDLEEIFQRCKTETLDEVGATYNIKKSTVHHLLKHMHPLY